jgi:putative transposase
MNTFIHFSPGVSVMHDGERYVITHILDLENVLAKHFESGRLKEIAIKEITPISENPSDDRRMKGTELSLIDSEVWNEAEKWNEKLLPLLEERTITLEKVQKVADEFGVHYVTVYRKLNTLKKIGKVSALIKETPDGGKGKSRLPDESELIIQNILNEFYFNKENKKRTKEETYEKIKGKLEAGNLYVPSRKTIYNRINSAIKARNRSNTDFDPESYVDTPIPGRITGADYPLALVQIDHTKVDINIVDEIYRQVIGRPWITVLIDVFSRMVIGFYLSLDPPGDMSVGQAIANSIQRKESWLAKFNITVPYPCWGIMSIIHADNAGEFHSNMIKRAGKEYSIDIEWRPVKQPRYGAHIERLLGSLLKRIHRLTGTTFSNVEEKGDYDSEKYAQMTLTELEEWILLFITGVYHQRIHKGLKMSPIKQYENGILGTKDIPGRGYPRAILNEDRLRLDLMPGEYRTIQESGVTWDYIWYKSGVLNRYKNATEPDNPNRKMKFLFKRDPRNISVIYFYDPELKEYFRVPYRNTSFPPISIWDYNKVRNYLDKLGIDEINEDIIFDTYKKLLAVEEKAAQKTKSARRAMERRRHHQQIEPPKTADDLHYNQQNDFTKQKATNLEDEIEITPYEEIEILD